MENSPSLNLPYLMPSQAQKHVTHNEAIRMLDGLVQISVLELDANAPPASPQEGERYIIGSGATGNWEGQDGKLAQFADGAWIYHEPKNGWLVWDAQNQAIKVLAGGTWLGVAELAAGQIANLQNLGMLGVNATADTNNRLSVASPGSLLNHEGGDHRLAINKAHEVDTASITLSDNYSGRAEIGLTGSNSLSMKTSPDGNQWQTVLTASPATGIVDFPAGLTSGGMPINAQGGGQGSGIISFASGISPTGYSITATGFVQITDVASYTAVSQTSSLLLNIVFSGFVRTNAGLEDAIGYLRPFYEQNGNSTPTYRQHLIGVQRMAPGIGQSSNYLYLAIPATFILDPGMKDQGDWRFGLLARCDDSDTRLQSYGFSWTALEIEA